jgi:hypothetical protein
VAAPSTIEIDGGESEQLVPNDAGRGQRLSIQKTYGHLDDQIAPIGIGHPPGDEPSVKVDGQKHMKSGER